MPKIKDNWTPLHGACARGVYLEIVKLLIQSGADTNAKGSEGTTPLHMACSIDEKLEVAKLLIEHGANVDAKDGGGVTVLQQACFNAVLDIIKLLVEKGVDLNFQVRWERSNSVAQRIRFSHLHRPLANSKVLAENGADVNVKNSIGKTPLHCACDFTGTDRLEMIKLFVEYGATVDAKDNDELTTLYIACSHGHLDIVQFLLGRGANVNMETALGTTPLHIASQQNHRDVVWLLVRQHPWLVLSEPEE